MLTQLGDLIGSLFGGAVNRVLIVTFLLALLVAGGSGLRSRDAWGNRMGAAKWSFGESWATTITVLSAILANLLSAKLIPVPETPSVETPDPTLQLPDPTLPFTGMSLLFAFLVLLAPVLYQAFSSRYVPPPPADDPPATATPATATATPTTASDPLAAKVIGPLDPAPDPTAQFLGYGVGFVIASVLTVWAVLGQLATVVLLLPLVEPAALAGLPGAVFRVALFAAMAFVLLYAFRTVGSVLRDQSIAEGEFRILDENKKFLGYAVPRPWNLL
jgi:hypothetical protein